MSVFEKEVYLLKRLRIARDLSQRELAEIIGVSNISVHNWEHRKHKMTDRNRHKVAKYFGVEPDQIQ